MKPLEQLQIKLHGIQGLRRRVERLASPYQGATGVRAQFYPHQLQTVLRILRDTQVRHLIADEVGLGKTVQALMVLNALRLQRGGKFRTIVVVPREQHARQWADEVWRRVHTTAYIDDELPVGDDWVHILWSAKLDRPAELLDPSRCDLIILDELQSLRSDVFSHVARRARHFQHLLALTATPDLRSAESLCRLMQLIEPDRVELSHRRITQTEGGTVSEVEDDDAMDDGGNEVAEIGQGVQEKVLVELRTMRAERPETIADQVDVSSLSEVQLGRLYDKAWWMFRRVIRSRRDDYPNHLPRRKQDVRIIEPLASEEERFRLMRHYLDGLLRRENDRNRAVVIARRVVVGGDALRDRLGELQRDGRDPDGELEEVKLLCRSVYGNSRLDELTDWLAEFWRKDPHQKVLVAAQDNPTIQFLEQQIRIRLPEVGCRGERQPLRIVTLVARTDQSENDLVDAYLSAQESIAPFESGNSQLAIAHDDFREAYNFQTADALVFYNIPWTPEHVDQWIGRVDRLGRETIDPERPHTPPVPVRILSIGQQGQIDQRMIDVYEASGVFQRPLQLDREEATRIADEIAEAGLGLRESNWNLLREELGSRSAGQQSLAIDQPVAFGTPEAAAELYDQMRFQKPVEPVLRHGSPLGYVSSDLEAALAKWLKLLQAHEYYHFHKNKDVDSPNDRTRRFYTISQNRSQDVGRLDRLDALEAPNWAPFFLTRKHIQRPPRRFVVLEGEKGRFPRTLEFLDHGCPLHEELVQKWIEAGAETNPRHGKTFFGFKLHLSVTQLPQDSTVHIGRFLVGVGHADPAEMLLGKSLKEDFLFEFGAAPNQSQENVRQQELLRLKVDHEADIRFVRSHIPAQLPIVGKVAGGEEITDKQRLVDLLTPVWSKEQRPYCEAIAMKPEQIQTQLPRYLSWFTEHLNIEVKEAWRQFIPDFCDCVRERMLLIEIDNQDTIADLQSQLELVESKIREFEEWPSQPNDLKIQLIFRPKMTRLKEQIELTRRRCLLRRQYLCEVLEYLQHPKVKLYQCLELYVEMLYTE